jgi:hypothetical protein
MKYNYKIEKVGKEYHVICYDSDNNMINAVFFKTKKAALNYYDSRVY